MEQKISDTVPLISNYYLCFLKLFTIFIVFLISFSKRPNMNVQMERTFSWKWVLKKLISNPKKKLRIKQKGIFNKLFWMGIRIFQQNDFGNNFRMCLFLIFSWVLKFAKFFVFFAYTNLCQENDFFAVSHGL